MYLVFRDSRRIFPLKSFQVRTSFICAQICKSSAFYADMLSDTIVYRTKSEHKLFSKIGQPSSSSRTRSFKRFLENKPEGHESKIHVGTDHADQLKRVFICHFQSEDVSLDSVKNLITAMINHERNVIERHTKKEAENDSDSSKSNDSGDAASRSENIKRLHDLNGILQRGEREEDLLDATEKTTMMELFANYCTKELSCNEVALIAICETLSEDLSKDFKLSKLHVNMEENKDKKMKLDQMFR